MKITKEEREMILDLAEEKNFPRETVEELFQNHEPIGTLGALSENQKFEYLYNAICLMKVDRDISPSEVLFCQDIAIRMGFRKDVVNVLAEQLEEKEHDPVRVANLKTLAYAYY